MDEDQDQRPDSAPGIRIVSSGIYSKYLDVCSNHGFQPEPKENFESDLDVQDTIDALLEHSRG